jgi:hypothetical protein
MSGWSPGSQAVADFIDFYDGGTSYLIGLGQRDASVFIVKLASNGNVDGYAWSRVTIDYTNAPPSPPSVRTMNNFGASCVSPAPEHKDPNYMNTAPHLPNLPRCLLAISVCKPPAPTRCHSYRYGDNIYFSSNTGSGIFQVDTSDLVAALGRTGSDKCDFSGTQYAH